MSWSKKSLHIPVNMRRMWSLASSPFPQAVKSPAWKLDSLSIEAEGIFQLIITQDRTKVIKESIYIDSKCGVRKGN
jgi:hypothetical protein